MRQWIVPALLLLQVVAHSAANEQHVLGNDAESATAKPEAAVETNIMPGTKGDWTPYQPGWELVDAAMAEFKKVKPPLYKRAKKQSGLFGIIFHYALKALPSMRLNAPPPPQEHPTSVLSGPLLEGVKLLQKSADLNNTDAIYLLAQLNFFGNYSHPRNFKTAFENYQRLALVNGNSSAQYMVGLMYATGLGDAVERDQSKALLYHTFAANQGHTRSEMTVASRYHSGTAVPKSCEMACKYYKRVADKAMAWYRSGPPGGMAIVSEAHRLADESGGVYGEGASVISSGINAVRHNPNSDAYASIDDVIEYLDLMSQKGDFKASYNLGRIYYEGQRGLDRDVDVARKYFLTVASKYWRVKDGRTADGSKPNLDKFAAKSAGFIGRMWLRGEGSLKQNFESAKKWFDRGITQGDAQSQWGLGIMLLKGHGMAKNVKRATVLLKAAADQDFSPAQVALGALHLDQGNTDDIRVANHYFESAARWGSIEAQYYLAEMIHHGVGRDKTCTLAMTYYKLVSEKAEPLLSAWAEANQAYEDGDYELALLDYVMSAEQGYEKAQNNVAYMLDPAQSALPLPSLMKQAPKAKLLQNSALALIYWTRSAIQSNIDSMVKMGDYYLAGIGTEPAVEKAAQCYTGASEYFQSAQALYNLGWMHENGIGLTQDFHLAKRYYDHALETSEEAYLAVTLSLLKLRIRSAWNTFTHGTINSIQDEPATKKDWSLSEWIANFLREDYLYDDEEYDDYYGDTITGSDGEPLGEEIQDSIVDSFVIIGLAAVIIFLVYYRRQRWQAHQRAEENAARAGGVAPPQPGAVPVGGQFPPWGAGG